MIWFILALLLLAGAVAAFIIGSRYARKVRTQDDRYRGDNEDNARYWRIAGVVLIAISVVTLALDSTVIVPTRNVGVETSFGKPVGALSNGFHVVAPWAKVQIFDATIQTLKKDGGKDGSIVVRLKNQTSATVTVTVQWRIETNADVVQLYKDYRSFDNIEANVVERQLQGALNEVFEGYDPLSSITGDGAQVVQLTDLAKLALPKLIAAMPKGVTVLNLTLPSITFDPVVQDNINKIIAAAAATKQAEQQEQTAKALAAAAALLGQSGDLNANVLYQNCLSMVERVLSAGHELPAGFTCGAPPTTVIPAK